MQAAKTSAEMSAHFRSVRRVLAGIFGLICTGGNAGRPAAAAMLLSGRILVCRIFVRSS